MRSDTRTRFRDVSYRRLQRNNCRTLNVIANIALEDDRVISGLRMSFAGLTSTGTCREQASIMARRTYRSLHEMRPLR